MIKMELTPAEWETAEVSRLPTRLHLIGLRRMELQTAVRRITEGISTILLLQSGLDEQRWSDSVQCYCCSRNVQDLLADGKLQMDGVLKTFSQWSNHTFGVKSKNIRDQRARGSVKLARKGSEVRPSNRIRQDIEEHRRFCRTTTRTRQFGSTA